MWLTELKPSLVPALWPQGGPYLAASVLGNSHNCPKPQCTHL